jgi:hypothetical protein
VGRDKSRFAGRVKCSADWLWRELSARHVSVACVKSCDPRRPE